MNATLSRYDGGNSGESIDLDDKGTLERLYVDGGFSEYKIARLSDETQGKVSSSLRKHGIIRPEDVRFSERELSQHYIADGKTIQETADELGTSKITVDRHLRYHGIKKTISEAQADRYRGEPATFRTNPKGYEEWGLRQVDGGGQVLVHRLVAVAECGFDAVEDMQVHHENGVPWDNRPENLELTTLRDHIKKHWYSGDVAQQMRNADDGEVAEWLDRAGYGDAAEVVRDA